MYILGNLIGVSQTELMQNACRFNSLDCIGQFVLYMVIQRQMLADISEHMFLNNVLPDLKKLVVD